MKDVKVSAKYLAYAKAIVAAIAGVLTIVGVVISVASDGNISGADWAAIGTALIGAAGGTGAVYQVPNVKQGE